MAITVTVVTVGLAIAQRSTPPVRPNRPAETSLVGVNIFDTGMLLLDMFGSPVQIQPLSAGGVGGGGAPGGGGGGGNNPAPTNSPANGGRTKQLPTAGVVGGDMIGNPFDPSLELRQGGGVPAGGEFGLDGGGGRGQPGNRGGGGGGNASGGGGGAAAGGGGARVLYTRWIYDRPAAKYSFIVDKFNRVVQIEAVGINDRNVVTSRGIAFGSTFADVLRAYNVPDAYEIRGDTIVMRYLVRDHVAFRLSRLKEDDPHRVTGIVVSAGKQ